VQLQADQVAGLRIEPAEVTEARADADARVAKARADAETRVAKAHADADARVAEVVTGALYRRHIISKHVVACSAECAICITPGEDCRLNACGHLFHEVCLVRWVSKAPRRNGCPLCRRRIL
jgi:Ring finger domain